MVRSPTYATIWKRDGPGHRVRSPGGLGHKDIIRLCIRGPGGSPHRYRYVSRRKHNAGKRSFRRFGPPPGWLDHKEPKHWRRCQGVGSQRRRTSMDARRSRPAHRRPRQVLALEAPPRRRRASRGMVAVRRSPRTRR